MRGPSLDGGRLAMVYRIPPDLAGFSGRLGGVFRPAGAAAAGRQPYRPAGCGCRPGYGRDWPFHRTPLMSGSDHSESASFDRVGWFTTRLRSTWGPTAYAQMP